MLGALKLAQLPEITDESHLLSKSCTISIVAKTENTEKCIRVNTLVDS
jgi:hypothetical protein